VTDESTTPEPDASGTGAPAEEPDATAMTPPPAGAAGEQAAEPPAEADAGPAAEPAASEPDPEAVPGTDAEAAAAPVVPKPTVPSPAVVASMVHPRSQVPTVPAPPPLSESARFGRADEQGRVFVRAGDGEREVGSYPGVTPDEALQYFARKYDELFASADLLQQRMHLPDVTSKEVADGLGTLKEHLEGANVVGDLPALDATVTAIEQGLAAKRETESAERAKAKEQAAAERERIVLDAEHVAGQPAGSTQWKTSGEQMRALLEEWKSHQRRGPKIDKTVENDLWRRFSHARNTFDKARRTWFAQLESTRSDAKSTKEALVKEAEALSSSRDWGPTARAFKNLMDQWRRAGRAARADDDALWARFKAAQDAFFSAKDQVAAAEDEVFRANLAVKEQLMVEAEAILPVTDLDAAKAALRVIQDKWDRAGKVPRADIERTEKVMRRVEGAVRDADDSRWRHSNPEVAARGRSMVSQLEAKVAALEDELTSAQASGNARRAADAASQLQTQRQWLDQVRSSLDEFSG
jgi:hypothetical protein